jgi:hypothetical protein
LVKRSICINIILALSVVCGEAVPRAGGKGGGLGREHSIREEHVIVNDGFSKLDWKAVELGLA